ncbi:hypothetical protein RFI_10991 [Reticulomyxa filosa]|uniref:Protein kinase domain-containing protein n=1 Tax=Reticulomyxa filosa TaxID=46433 RepID=X6NJH2_RETFI|nr:hypothetical protein RFI_10991 [Reticulomyxa filosa]|eukprot:ETO26146.1 hypothetical protein RFI_10991 [Reticulomyxa filosa]
MHLDFKPNNIMINSHKISTTQCDGLTLVKLVNPRITLIDFSVSTKASREVDLDEYPCRGHYGTRRYRAPEMIFGGVWNRSIDSFAVALITLECVNLTRLMENKYRDQNGRRFPRCKDSKGRKTYDKREIIDYIMRMAKTFMGKPSLPFLNSLEEEYRPFVQDAIHLMKREEYHANLKKKENTKTRRNTKKARKSGNYSSQDGTPIPQRDEAETGVTVEEEEVDEDANDESSDGTDKAMDKNVGNPFYTPIHAFCFEHGPTLSDVHQSHLYVSSREAIIATYLKMYRPFIHCNMISDKDIVRLNHIEKAMNQILIWNRFERWTPELLFQYYFQEDKEFLYTCLFTKEELSKLQSHGFDDDFIQKCVKMQTRKRNAGVEKDSSQHVNENETKKDSSKITNGHKNESKDINGNSNSDTDNYSQNNVQNRQPIRKNDKQTKIFSFCKGTTNLLSLFTFCLVGFCCPCYGFQSTGSKKGLIDA